MIYHSYMIFIKYWLPYAYAKDIFEVDMAFYKKHNVKYLLLDLDNTLDSYRLYQPSQRVIDFVNTLKENDITPIIISNNTGKRVTGYANTLGIEFRHSIGKPFARGILKLIKELGVSKDEVMAVGDQMITDITAANRAGIKSILTDKIVKEDQWTTHFNRFFERGYRSRVMKKGKIKDWRELL